jgi:hypothetical protein
VPAGRRNGELNAGHARFSLAGDDVAVGETLKHEELEHAVDCINGYIAVRFFYFLRFFLFFKTLKHEELEHAVDCI